jgi:DNA-binding NtrC family response regulator
MKNLLLLDDDEGPLFALGEALENHYNITTAQTIKAAQMIMEDPNNNIDLIVTDYHLGKSGTASELINYIRISQFMKIRNLPVIVISADISQKWSVESQNTSFMLKPFKIHEVLDQIKSKLGE